LLNRGELMDLKAINLKEKFLKFSTHWSPKIVAKMNDYHFKLVKIKGEFVWHNHSETDEVFIVIDGKMVINFENDKVELSSGELFVVPKGVEHKPYSKDECKILVIEPKGVVNTGDVVSEMTVNEEKWV